MPWCPCWTCRGLKHYVRQRTINDHMADQNAAFNQLVGPQIPLAGMAPLAALAAPAPANNASDDDVEMWADGDDYVDGNPIRSLAGWDTLVTDSSRTLAEVAYTLYDWQVRHKATNAAAKGVWDFGANLLPENNTMGNFGDLEAMLKLHRAETVIKVHCCPEMCVSFTNPTHHSLAGRLDLMNAHRTVCPVCGAARYVHGTKKPVRVFWYMPLKFWLQDLFAKGDLVPHMANDLDPKSYPDGHVRRSDGWRQKVTDNPNINADRRNIALAAGCDGIPFHNDKQAASGWPFVVTCENLPAGTYRKNQHQHVFALTPSEEIKYDGNGHPFVFKRDPPSIQPVLQMLTEELLEAQDKGLPMRDFSLPVDDPDHFFLLRLILLFYMGDYPGQGKVANMVHTGVKACHWCHHKFRFHSPGHNVATGTRRHLDPGDPTRQCDTWPEEETQDPPKIRDHAKTCAYAEMMKDLKGIGSSSPIIMNENNMHDNNNNNINNSNTNTHTNNTCNNHDRHTNMNIICQECWASEGMDRGWGTYML
jgi:hypothetical protein